MFAFAKDLIRRFALHTPYARYFLPIYEFQFDPPNLCFLAECIQRTSRIDGCVLEVGCYRGATTIWLCKTMATLGLRKPFHAVDTFHGFTAEHLDHESLHRNKDRKQLAAQFEKNSKFAFERTMQINGFDFVTAFRADAAQFDYGALGTISFALIDVDLYLPVKAAIEGVYPMMAEGGIIAVDDCKSNTIVDGALQAYLEFIAKKELPKNIVNGKLGVIER